MAKGKFVSWVLVMVVALSLTLSGCTTFATRGGNVTPVGFLTPTFQANAGRNLVGSYIILFGLFTIGYGDFVRQTDGVEIDIVDQNFFFIFRQIRALERNTPQE